MFFICAEKHVKKSVREDKNHERVEKPVQKITDVSTDIKSRKANFMKFMNNHYGQSRIFGGKVRFAAEPDGDGSNGIGEEGGAGGSSEGTEDNDGSDDISLEELKLQLAREKAEKERYKSSIDNLTKKNKELTDKTRKYMTDEQKAQEDKEARDQELEELKKEVRISKYSKRLVGFGMSESEADELAGTIPELEDADAFFDTIGRFIDSVKKSAGESAVQELLKKRPDINAGNGDGGNSVAEEKARAIGKRNAGRVTEHKVVDYYK